LKKLVKIFIHKKIKKGVLKPTPHLTSPHERGGIVLSPPFIGGLGRDGYFF
jgi:hypothetical protein